MIALVGPTASGKTRLALEVARRYDAEIIGVDASQVYRGMSVGTGKVTQDELGGVVHHLIDVVDPDQHFDAKGYADLADALIKDAQRRGKRVVLCGGTGLYLRALLRGLCEAPPVSEPVAEALRTRLRRDGLGTLYTELEAVDPASSARINPNDAQRIERALGVFLTSDRPLSVWQSAQARQGPRYDCTVFGLRWARPALNIRIENRVKEMVAGGWCAEVETLVGLGFEASLKSMGALGYRLLASHLRGEMSLSEAESRIIVATKRYAKRQMTWFKADSSITWLDAPITAEDWFVYLDEIWTS